MPAREHDAHAPVTGLLRNRNFILLWAAYGVSAVGDHLSEIALLATQDALSTNVDMTPLTARISFIFFLPFFFVCPFAGALADAFSRRGLMVTADLGRAAVLLVFVYLLAWTQNWGTWGAFSPLLLLGGFAAIFSPARSALVPTIVPGDQLVRANAMLSGLGIIATMVSAVIGGWLAQHYTPAAAFRVNAITFMGSAALLFCMSLPRAAVHPSENHRDRSGLRDLRDGWTYVRAHRHVFELMIIASIIWFCGSLVHSVIPAVVRDVYGGNFQTISIYRALLGAGFIGGAVVMTILGPALRSEVAITWGLYGVTLGIGVFAASVFIGASQTTCRTLGAVGIVTAGFFAVAVMASFDALLQRTVANRFRGRVFGVKELVSTGTLLVATGALGVPEWKRLDQWVGWILLGVAALTMAFGITSITVRLRRGVHPPKYMFAEHLNEFIAKFWWRFRRIGPSRVPPSGPVIIAANHICSADPVFISAAAPYRLISFIIAAEYATWPGIRRLVKFLDCIPVRRGSREAAGSAKQALRHLENGKAMGIFIEGGIIPPGEPRRPKDGVATLALRSGAMVIPAYISGIKYRDGIIAGLLTRHHARLQFGPPVDLREFAEMPRNRETIRAATRKIYQAILALAPPGERVEGEIPDADEDVTEIDEVVGGGDGAAASAVSKPPG